MNVDHIMRVGIKPALKLLPGSMDTPQARIMLLAIGLQESNFEHRRQLVGDPPQPVGPAKSFWQAERGGGMVKGVRQHPATQLHAATLYKARGVAPSDQAIWDAIENDDVLAAGLARLLLFSDPARLPQQDDVEGAWQMYLRTWRPGAWARGTPEQRRQLRMKWSTKHDIARTSGIQL